MGNLLDQLKHRGRTVIRFLLPVTLVGAAVWLAISTFEADPAPDPVRRQQDSLSEKEASPTVPLRRSRPSMAGSEDLSDPDGLPDETINLWLGRASRDPVGTLEQVMALDDPHQRQELLDWILSAWTADDRAPALEWLANAAPVLPQGRAGEVLDPLMGPWAAENAVSAIEWVRSSLTVTHQTQALQAIAASWSLANPDEMEAWILAQDQPQDFWMLELIQGLIMSEPRKAMEWSMRLSDTGPAEDIKQNVIQSWLLAEPAAAEDFLKQHPAFEVEAKPETAIAE